MMTIDIFRLLFTFRINLILFTYLRTIGIREPYLTEFF